MFNLEQAIREWREQLSAEGIKKAELEELESHLRERLEGHIGSGAGEEPAFREAVGSLGQPRNLGKEFAKSHRRRDPGEMVLLGICAVMVGGILFLAAAAAYLCYSTWWERGMAGGAMLLTLMLALGWRRLVPLFPAIANRRARVVYILGAMAAAFAVATCYTQVAVAHIRPTDGMLPALGLFAMVPVAFGFCAILVFPEAARRGIKI